MAGVVFVAGEVVDFGFAPLLVDAVEMVAVGVAFLVGFVFVGPDVVVVGLAPSVAGFAFVAVKVVVVGFAPSVVGFVFVVVEAVAGVVGIGAGAV